MKDSQRVALVFYDYRGERQDWEEFYEQGFLGFFYLVDKDKGLLIRLFWIFVKIFYQFIDEIYFEGWWCCCVEFFYYFIDLEGNIM